MTLKDHWSKGYVTFLVPARNYFFPVKGLGEGGELQLMVPFPEGTQVKSVLNPK